MAKTKRIFLVCAAILGGLFYAFFPIIQFPEPRYSEVAGQNTGPLPVVTVAHPTLKPEAKPFFPEAVVVYAVDLRTGQPLFDKQSLIRWPTASLAKLMTALVVVNTVSGDEVAEVEKADLEVSQAVMGLQEGEKISVTDLLKGMLIASANDAASVLARRVAGSQEGFAELMNLMAQQLGLKDTHFDNSIGFDSEDQYSTGRDLAVLTAAFLKNPELAEMVKTRSLAVKSADGAITHWLKSSNKLLESRNIYGVKTGYTDAALGNLVLYAVGDGEGSDGVITVVLGSEQREADSQALVDWIFTSYDF